AVVVLKRLNDADGRLDGKQGVLARDAVAAVVGVVSDQTAVVRNAYKVFASRVVAVLRGKCGRVSHCFDAAEGVIGEGQRLAGRVCQAGQPPVRVGGGDAVAVEVLYVIQQAVGPKGAGETVRFAQQVASARDIGQGPVVTGLSVIIDFRCKHGAAIRL